MTSEAWNELLRTLCGPTASTGAVILRPGTKIQERRISERSLRPMTQHMQRARTCDKPAPPPRPGRFGAGREEGGLRIAERGE